MVALRDFNQTLTTSEHSMVEPHSMVGGMREFNDCLSFSDLFDLSCIGNIYTWSNNQVQTPIAKKLDRILINGN